MASLTYPLLRSVALRGSILTAVGFGVGQVIRLGGNLLLTRLLVPDAFGLMSIAGVMYIGLSLLSDIGLEAGIVRDPHGDDPTFLDTAWTLQSARGVLLWLVSLVIAWPVASFYAEARLLWLIPLVGVSLVLGGFTAPSLILLKRHMAIAHLVALDITVQLVMVTALVLLARQYPQPWVLALGYLIPAGLRGAWSHWLSRARPPRWRLDRAMTHDLLRFGGWFWVATALYFLAS